MEGRGVEGGKDGPGLLGGRAHPLCCRPGNIHILFTPKLQARRRRGTRSPGRWSSQSRSVVVYNSVLLSTITLTLHTAYRSSTSRCSRSTRAPSGDFLSSHLVLPRLRPCQNPSTHVSTQACSIPTCSSPTPQPSPILILILTTTTTPSAERSPHAQTAPLTDLPNRRQEPPPRRSRMESRLHLRPSDQAPHLPSVNRLHLPQQHHLRHLTRQERRQSQCLQAMTSHHSVTASRRNRASFRNTLQPERPVSRSESVKTLSLSLGGMVYAQDGRMRCRGTMGTRRWGGKMEMLGWRDILVSSCAHASSSRSLLNLS